MRIVAAAIERYRLTVLGILLLLILGSFTYIIIPRQEDPIINTPGATVIVGYPGAGPRDIEQNIVRPLEEKIDEIEEVDTITATADQGMAIVSIEFNPDTDIDQNIQSLREKVREAENELPDDVMDPEILKWKTDTVSMIINLNGPFNNLELYKYAKQIKRSLESIPGILRIEIEGDQEREIHVEVDQNRLALYGISLEELTSRIAMENISLPGGNMDVGPGSYLVRVDEQYSDAEEIGRTIIGSLEGRPVFLKDIAQIKDTFERPEYIVRFNGLESINILITCELKSSVISVSKNIKKRLSALEQLLSPQLNVNIFSDQAESISGRLSVFQNNLLMGAGLVVLFTIIMMNFRMAMVVTFLIPLSIAFALIILYHLDHTLNQITLASMVIVLGMLVDNGIVVVENIQRHMGMQKSRLTAALDGSREVLGAITSSTLTTVLAFTPLLFMSGDTGQFIRGIPLTMIFALIGSLLVAVFVSPFLSYRFLHKDGSNENRENKILKGYLIILRWSLHHKFLTLLFVIGAFIGAVFFIPRLGLQFFPKAEKDIFIMEVSLPSGTNIDETLDLAKRIETRLRKEKSIRDVMAHVGGNGARIYYNINFNPERSSNRTQFFVTVNQDIKNGGVEQIIKKLRSLFSQVPGAEIELNELEQGPPVGAPIALKIKGDDLDVLKEIAIKYRSLLETIPGVIDIRDNASRTTPQIRVNVDSDKARTLGISNQSIAFAIRTYIYGAEAGTITLDDEEVDIIVSLGKEARDDLGTFDKIYLKSMTGAKIPLRQIANISLLSDIESITREDLTRTVTVRADVDGVLPEKVVSSLKKKADSIRLRQGYIVEYEGENKDRNESFISLGWAMIAAFFLVYIVLVAQFNSFRQPLIIAFSLPFGLTGAVLGLWIMGYPFGFMAFLGVVSLIGIVVNDAIVLIDFINVTRNKEQDIVKAVIEAAKVRFRPVILTTVSTVGGLAPLAIRGGSLWGPMGNVIIFGLTLATILTLIIVPVLYLVLEKEKMIHP